MWPHLFQHHFNHTWLNCGGPKGDLMELSGWSSPQMLRRTYDRIMEGST